MFIRLAVPEDVPVLKTLYHDTITAIGALYYDTAQVAAWASTAENTDSFIRRIATQYFYVAVEETPPAAAVDGKGFWDRGIVGFASLEKRPDEVHGDRRIHEGEHAPRRGHLDLLYVHKDFQRQGVAGRLLACILGKAVEQGFSGIGVEASIVACPFFEKHRFNVEAEQTVFVRDIGLTNYRMFLDLFSVS